MVFEDVVKPRTKVMVIGIGGGGDVVGTLPTARYLRALGAEPIVGGLTWERYVNDPEPGPRRLSEIENIERVSKTVALASGETRTRKGVVFTESVVARFLGEKTVLVDPNDGVRGIIDGLNEALAKLGVELFVGIDVGGDVIASGKEEGLHSMLADSMMLAAMCSLDVSAVLGIMGAGTDGELTPEQFTNQLAKVARHGGLLGARGLTKKDIEILEDLIPRTKTEASRLAVLAAKGTVGEVEIRGGYRKVHLTPLAALTFYLDPKVVLEHVNTVAKKLIETESLEEAHKILESEGVPSELTFERNFVWKKFADRDELLRRGMG
jgi:hypothetical protein